MQTSSLSMIGLVSIAAAGSLGAVSRCLLDHLVRTAAPGLPLSTLVVNVVGCFGFGLCWSVGLGRWSPNVAAVVLVGFFGAFTTFSSFAFDCCAMWQERRYGMLVADLLGQNLLGLLAMWAGIVAGGGPARG